MFPFSGDMTPIVLLNNNGNLWDGNYSFQKDYRLIIVYIASGAAKLPEISLNFSGSTTLEQNTSNSKVKIAYKQNVKTGESLNYSANAYITGLILAFV